MDYICRHVLVGQHIISRPDLTAVTEIIQMYEVTAPVNVARILFHI